MAGKEERRLGEPGDACGRVGIVGDLLLSPDLVVPEVEDVDGQLLGLALDLHLEVLGALEEQDELPGSGRGGGCEE